MKDPITLEGREYERLSYTAIDLNPTFKGQCAGEVLAMWKRCSRNMTVTVRLKDIHDAVQKGMTGGVYLLKFSVNGEKIAEVKVVP